MPLAAIGIVVDDLDRARDLYRHLRIEIAEDPEGHGHAEAELPNGLRLMFDTPELIRSFDASWTRGTGSPATVLAFSFDTPAEVDAKHAELLEAGASDHLPPWDAFWGMRYASVRDPDGNGIDLFARL